jgi:hypothetical protein
MARGGIDVPSPQALTSPGSSDESTQVQEWTSLGRLGAVSVGCIDGEIFRRTRLCKTAFPVASVLCPFVVGPPGVAVNVPKCCNLYYDDCRMSLIENAGKLKPAAQSKEERGSCLSFLKGAWMMIILIPCKGLDQGKSRLSAALDAHARRALCEFFLCRTLAIARTLTGPDCIRVLSPRSERG